jgi:endo-1,4-beta-xylanase
MVLFGFLSTALTMAAGILAAPSTQPLPPLFGRNEHARAAGNTPNGQGMHEGYYYFWWQDGVESNIAIYDNGPKGSYAMEWNVQGNLLGGKGWATGGPRNITYSANWEPVDNTNSYLSVYGEARKPNAEFNSVEYYIIESHGSYNPGLNPDLKSRGTSAVDGGVYKIFESVRFIWNRPTIRQYWAIRENMRTSGTVNVGEIFDIWAGYGMTFEEHGMQILATEAYRGAGRSEVTIRTPA